MSSQESLTIRKVREVNDQSHPRTVRELVKLVRARDADLSEEEVVVAVELLRSTGRLILKPRSFSDFMGFFLNLRWNLAFWGVFSIAAISMVLYALAGGFPWSLLQIVPGVLLIFYLPGHSFLKVLFSRENVLPFERIVLEIGTSIVLLFLVGLLLNFSGLGLFTAPALSSVVVLNLLLALWASHHDYVSYVH